MDNKKTILGGLAGGVTFFLLGWLFYGILMKNYMAGQTTAGVYKDIPDFPWLIVGNIVLGLLYAVVIGNWAKAMTFGSGAMKGLALAFLNGLGYDMIMYSTSNIMTMQGVLADVVVISVMGAIAGGVVAIVMRPGKS